MATRTTALLAFVLSTLLAGGIVSAQDESAGQPEALPAAEQVLEDYIEAIGGRDVVETHRNRVFHGVHYSPANETYQVLTLWAERPNRLFARVEVPGIGTTIRATDGEVVWGSNLDGPVFEITEAEKVEFLDSAIFAGEADYQERYSELRTSRVIPMSGRDSYQIDFVTTSGLRGACYFDVETKLLVARLVASEDGSSPFIFLGDYQEFDGLLLPTRQQQQQDQQVISEFTFRKIEVNVDEMPEFAMPQLAAADG